MKCPFADEALALLGWQQWQEEQPQWPLPDPVTIQIKCEIHCNLKKQKQKHTIYSAVASLFWA